MSALEVDSDLGVESESNYYSGLESDTTSLISAAKNYVFENGRRYHGYKEVSDPRKFRRRCNAKPDGEPLMISKGKYMVPNDEAEQDRMDLLHHCSLLALGGKLFLAPVGNDWNPQRVLDVGTGTGIWAIQFADDHPNSQVIGVDLSPIQPNWVPPNVTFEVDDIEEKWQYQDESFDFIYFRTMAGFISDWPKLYRQAYRALRPGGWIEVHDFFRAFTTDDGSLPETSALTALLDNWDKGSVMAGRQYKTVAPNIANSLRDVGCVEIGEKITKIPIGRWAKGNHHKNLGTYWRQHMLDGIEGIIVGLFTRVLGWSKEQVDAFIPKVNEDLRNPKYHVYSEFYCTYGRKPLE